MIINPDGRARGGAIEENAFVHKRHRRSVSGDNESFARVMGVWEEVIADMGATAAEYREADWEVLELHPGDVTALDGERYGLDVLVPGDEFEELETLAAETTFESYEVYRAEHEGMTFALVVLESPDSERAVCCPTYYERDSGELGRRAHEEGLMHTHIRPLSDDRAVTFSYEDPGLFFPE